MICEVCKGSGVVSGEVYLGVQGSEPCPECDGEGGTEERELSAAERIAVALQQALEVIP